MPGVSKEQIASAKKMTAIEFLRRYRSTDLVKSSARGEFELRSHDSFKINGESSIWHWKSRGIGGKSALDYLVHVEQCGFVEAVRMLCDEVPGYIPVPHEAVEQKRPAFTLPPAAPNNARVVAYLCGRGVSVFPLGYRLAADTDGFRNKLLGHFAAHTVLPQGFGQGLAGGFLFFPHFVGVDVNPQRLDDQPQQVDTDNAHSQHERKIEYRPKNAKYLIFHFIISYQQLAVGGAPPGKTRPDGPAPCVLLALL